jgi:hypothetical protein
MSTFQNIQMQVQLSFQKTHVIGFKKKVMLVDEISYKNSVISWPLILMRSLKSFKWGEVYSPTL